MARESRWCPAFPGELAPVKWCDLAKGDWCFGVSCGRVKKSGDSLYQAEKAKGKRLGRNERILKNKPYFLDRKNRETDTGIGKGYAGNCPLPDNLSVCKYAWVVLSTITNALP